MQVVNMCSAFLRTGNYHLGEVDELLEEVLLQPWKSWPVECGQVEVAGNLGNQGWVAIVLAVPAGQPSSSLSPWALDSMHVVAVTCI